MNAATNVSNGDITPSQSRAARALLDWRLKRLSEACGLPKRTLVRFEGEETVPRAATVAAIRTALEAAGVEFIPENGGGAGVRLRLARMSPVK
jgi:transcriptional regulator with XRE-family HTH domain